MTESSLVSRRPSNTTSYSTSLLEAGNVNLTAYAMDKPFGDYRIIPAPSLVALDKSSVSRSRDGSQRSRGCTSDMLAIKSARI